MLGTQPSFRTAHRERHKPYAKWFMAICLTASVFYSCASTQPDLSSWPTVALSDQVDDALNGRSVVRPSGADAYDLNLLIGTLYRVPRTGAAASYSENDHLGRIASLRGKPVHITWAATKAGYVKASAAANASCLSIFLAGISGESIVEYRVTDVEAVAYDSGSDNLLTDGQLASVNNQARAHAELFSKGDEIAYVVSVVRSIVEVRTYGQVSWDAHVSGRGVCIGGSYFLQRDETSLDSVYRVSVEQVTRSPRLEWRDIVMN
jgi:hypothetical protein